MLDCWMEGEVHVHVHVGEKMGRYLFLGVGLYHGLRIAFDAVRG